MMLDDGDEDMLIFKDDHKESEIFQFVKTSIGAFVAKEIKIDYETEE